MLLSEEVSCECENKLIQLFSDKHVQRWAFYIKQFNRLSQGHKIGCVQTKLPQKPVVFSLAILYYRLKNMNNNLCIFLIMLSTYGYFLSQTIMFWCCVMWNQLRLPSAWHPNSMQINPTHGWTVSAGWKNLVNFNFFKYYLNMDYTDVAAFHGLCELIR